MIDSYVFEGETTLEEPTPKLPFRELITGDIFFNEDGCECQKIWLNKYLVFSENKEPLRIELCDPNIIVDFDWDWHNWYENLINSNDEE